ncbi:unnamed protein product [Prorocentrum cordatum]|uniref:Uncharacterized protein n=1 Tax=Prorocentrum cordatum TaxID=2364126 RepID=A0ABN9PZ01_9DINO|nr:unnamed protein product [Polarella glacialis]
MNAKHLASQASCKERTARTNARIPRPCKSRRGSPRTVRSVFFAARFTRVAARPIERQGSPTKKQHEHAHLFHVRLVDSSPISAAADVHVCARPESARSRSASPVRGCRLCSLPVPVTTTCHTTIMHCHSAAAGTLGSATGKLCVRVAGCSLVLGIGQHLKLALHPLPRLPLPLPHRCRPPRQESAPEPCTPRGLPRHRACSR